MKKKSELQSIHDYLGLGHRGWYVEFEIGDFRTSLTSLLEIPQEIYKKQAKDFFWSFIQLFLQKCEISFILRQPCPADSRSDRVDLALLGYWENKRFAIPLWIINDLFLGFEIVPAENFTILDSEPIIWSQLVSMRERVVNSLYNDNSSYIFLNDGIFQGQKIYFKLEGGQIVVSKYYNELKFFERIAQTDIPEIDEGKDK